MRFKFSEKMGYKSHMKSNNMLKINKRYMRNIQLLFVFVVFFNTVKAQLTYNVTYHESSLMSIGNPGKLNTENDNSSTGWSAYTFASVSSNLWIPTSTSYITMPFDFYFFDKKVTKLKCTFNGLITFSTPTTTTGPTTKATLPSSTLLENTIACFWSDFTSPNGGNDKIMVKTFGTAPNRQFWIKWAQIENGTNYFACVLEESTNKMYMVDMVAGNPISRIVGIQKNTSQYFQYASAVTLVSKLNLCSDNSFYEFDPVYSNTTELKSTAIAKGNSASIFPDYLNNNCFSTYDIKSSFLEARLNTGDRFLFGGNTFSVNVKLNASIYSSLGASTPALLEQKNIELAIDGTHPEALFSYDITGHYSNIKRVDYKIISITTTCADVKLKTAITQKLNLKLYINEEYGYDVNSYGSSFISPTTVASPQTGNRVKFEWEPFCNNVYAYQLQILRLYNTHDAYKMEAKKCSTIVDWSQALTVDLPGDKKNISLTIPQGTGYYVWRIRPIGNYYDGEVANNENWGSWETAYEDGDAFNETDPTSIGHAAMTFYYEQPNKKLPTVYSRTFSDNYQYFEGIIFGNLIGQQLQSQSYLPSEDKLVVKQNVYDHSGRTSLVLMPAVVDQNEFNYINDLAKANSKSYGPENFDEDDNYNKPDPLDGGKIHEFWSDQNPDPTIDDAKGYPFTKINFLNDGTDRIIESSLPGEVHAMGSEVSGSTRTTTMNYTTATDDELVRVFGDEAESDQFVRKIVTSDPNHINTATYVDAQGKTIATCLTNNFDLTNLSELETKGDVYEVTDEADILMSVGDYMLKYKDFSLANGTTTDLTVNYNLNLNHYGLDCENICKNCDYELKVYLLNTDNTDIKYSLYEDVIELTDCNDLPVINYSEIVKDIPIGNYRIVRTLTPLNGVYSVYNEFVSSFNTATETELDAIYTSLETGTENFYSYIDSNYTVEYIADDSIKFSLLNDECVTISLPIVQCEEFSCDPDNPFDYEAYLIERWGEQYGDMVSDYFRGEMPHGAITEAYFYIRNIEASYLGFFPTTLKIKVDNEEIVLINNLNIGSIFSSPTDLAKEIVDKINAWSTLFNPMGSHNYIAKYESAGFDKVTIYPLLQDYHTGVSPKGEIILENEGYATIQTQMEFKTSTKTSVVVNDGLNFKTLFADNATYPLGAGAFNAMVYNARNSGLYECEDVHYAVISAIDNFGVVAYDGDGNRNPDFYFLQYVISMIGPKFSGSSDCPYGTCSQGKGFIDYAYQYFNTDMECDLCKTYYDYDDSHASWTTSDWYNYYLCSFYNYHGYPLEEVLDQPLVMKDIQKDGIDMIESICISACEQKMDKFIEILEDYYTDLGQQVSYTDLFCLANAMKDECISVCELSETWNGDVIEQAGTEEEYNTFLSILTGTPYISTDENCEGYEAESEGTSLAYAVAYALNREAERLYDSGETFVKLGWFASTLTDNFSGHDFLSQDISNSTNLMAFVSTLNVEVKLTSGDLFKVVDLDSANCYSIEYIVDDPYTKLYIPFICEVSGCGPICFDFKTFDAPATYEYEIRTCDDIYQDYLSNLISIGINSYKENVKEELELAYTAKCLDVNEIKDELTFGYKLGTYHYTLFYYDRAGRLIKTISPKGVVASDAYTRESEPAHSFITYYEYNSLGLLTKKQTPDGGLEQYWYDKVGRLRFSQNAVQKQEEAIAYIKYDELGRATESGKHYIKAALTHGLFGSYMASSETLQSALENIDDMSYPSTKNEEQTFTVYSTPANVTDVEQEYLQNRISYTYNITQDWPTVEFAATYYSYDVHGNVKKTYEYNPDLGFLNISEFEYDLLSGKITAVKYNEGRTDQFFHKYSYDEQNRIITVETSKDNKIWETDARYEYYAHGPLKRTVIGHDKIQGLDYVYNILGMLKGVNHPSLLSTYDPGKDGNTSAADLMPADVFGYMINYYQNDFNRTGSAFNSNTTDNPSYNADYTSLYNGNIASIVSNTTTPNVGLQYENMITSEKYGYDELGRLMSSDFGYVDNVLKTWQTTTDYATSYKYDANGNITNLTRNAYDPAKTRKYITK